MPNLADPLGKSTLNKQIFALLAVSAALVLSIGPACASPAATSTPPPAPKINEVSFIATDYTFSGPDGIPAGMTRLQLTNQGKELHQLRLFRLTQGKTVDDLKALLLGTPQRPPDWVTQWGGPNAIIAGGKGSAILNLELGNYGLICELRNSQGIRHLELGQIRPLTVTAPTGPLAAEPNSDITIDTSDFKFDLSGSTTTGKHTIRVNNVGPRAHEAVLVKLAPGASVQDFITASEAHTPGVLLPLATELTGVASMAAGVWNYFTVEFTPGKYLLICNLPEPRTGQRHYALGQVLEFIVK